ncbi:MAG TPA: universal stress protein [Polyangiaceae bacterium]|nr:universal stress protein [Polyangiaceae bacterium]
MPELKRILVPVDFSTCSREALRQAIELAASFDAEVHAVHVWEPSPYVSPDSLVWLNGEQKSFWDHMRLQLIEQLRAAVDEAVSASGSKPAVIATKVVSGYTSETILSTVRDEGFDMVVMGTHGRTGLTHVLLGSVAERIVRLASCPVMTIKPCEPSKDSGAPELPKGFDTPTML